MGAMALLSVFTMALTSCSDDNDAPTNGNIIFDDVEIGHDNSKVGTIGDDIHLEFEVKSSAKIKSIAVSFVKDANNKVEKVYNSLKYVGVLNTTFHEHLDLPETLAEGVYTCTITVTNEQGGVKTIIEKVNLLKKVVDPNAPKITNLKVNTMSGTANGKVTFTANIVTTSPIDEIEVEFHGDKEHEVEVNDYNGKSGNITFTKDITIPANCKAGTYHIHFTVKDTKGLETTEEIEDFIVK